MIRITRLAILLVLTIFCAQISAQNLLDGMVNIKRLIDQDQYDAAYTQLQNIEEQCVHSDNDSVKVLFYECMGFIKFERQEYQDAIKYFEPVPGLYERLNIKDKNYVEAFLALGLSYQHLGNDSIAETYYRTGLLRTENSKHTLQYRSSFYLNLGQIYKERGDTLLAAECFKRINPQQYVELIDGKADSLIDDREEQALEMRENGEFEQCLPIYDQLIKRCTETVGTKNEDYLRLLFSKAFVLYFNLHRSAAAKPLFKELYEMRNDLAGYDENLFVSMACYLQITAAEGDSLGVDSILPMALSYASRSHKETHISALYRMIGNGFYWSNYYFQAIPYYEKYITFAQKEDGLSYLEVPNMLAACYLSTNSQGKARKLLQELIGKYKEDIENNPTLKSQLFHNYGRALMLCGQYKEAVDCFVIANKAYKEFTGEDNPKTLSYLEECKRYS